MNSKRQDGSALVVIIVISVLAILGLVGYVFWTKLNTASTSTDNGNAQSGISNKNADNLKTVSFDKSFGITMNFKYPKTWTLSSKQSGVFPVTAKDTSEEAFTVTSPDKKYDVVYRLGAGGGVGGACDEESAAKIVAVEQETVEGWKGVKLVRAITKTQAGKYVSEVRLISAGLLSGIKVGGSSCKLGLSIVSVPSMQFDLTLLDGSVHTSMDMNVMDGMSDNGVSSEKAVRQLFSGKSFDEAKAILLSTVLR